MLATILVYLSQYIGTCITNDLKDINTHIHIEEDFFVSNRNAFTYVVSYNLSDNGILGVTKGYKLYDEALKHIEHKINLLCLLSNKYALEKKTTHDERGKINKLCNYSTRIEKAIKNIVDNFFDIFERNSADISGLMSVGIRHLDNFRVAFVDYYYKYKHSIRLNRIQYEFRMFEAIYKHCDEEHEKVVGNYRHLISSNALSRLDALQKLITFKQKCFENALANLGLSVDESE